ncbi:MAG TPA: hypothetical protein VH796_17400 [Nitrososphaeraceae archaeon]|jgi:hypothetical protein
MSLHYLSQEEICDISKILGQILKRNSRHEKMKESSLYIILEWLREEGIDMNTLEMIVKNIPTEELTITEMALNQEIWKIFSTSQFDITYNTEAIVRDSSCLYNTLTEINTIDKEICEITIRALKTIIPQKQINDLQYKNRLAHTIGLEDKVYGILSYDGPIIAICDIEKNQVVKGTVITKDDKKGREYNTVRLSEIILEAVPVKVIIYDDASDIEIKYEVKWRTSLNSSFAVGPASLREMILILKQKSLILQENVCDTALISIFKAFIQRGKGVVYQKLPQPYS